LRQFALFLRIGNEIFSGFCDKFQKKVTCRFFNQICENKLENCRKLNQNSGMCDNYFLFFIRILNRYSCRQARRGGFLGSSPIPPLMQAGLQGHVLEVTFLLAPSACGYVSVFSMQYWTFCTAFYIICRSSQQI